jgi:prepilin-type N-terminal cleavage/methylation domain-containing protein
MRTARQTGFSLIEILVGMSIIALLLVCAFSAGSDMMWVSHEADYNNALRLLKHNDRIISTKNTDSLPPEIRTIPPSGKVQLSNTNIVPGSIAIISLDNTEILPGDYSADYGNGLIAFTQGGYSGKKIMIKYAFSIPDDGELVRVPAKAPHTVQILNSPAAKIIKIETLVNGTGTIVSENLYKINPKSGVITIDPSLAGKCLKITCLGGRIKSYCTGKFLQPENLEESASPTPVKLIKIKEVYGSGGNSLETIGMRFGEVKNAK